MEGFGVPGARPTRNNNPGDIEYGRFARSHGAVGTDGRFAVFNSVEAGYCAMRALLQMPAYSGLTIHQAIAKYAPPDENNVGEYVNCVCEWAKLSPSDDFQSNLG